MMLRNDTVASSCSPQAADAFYTAVALYIIYIYVTVDDVKH